MLFSLGAIELLFLLVILVAVGLLRVGRHRYHRAGIATLVCVSLAAITTPADLASTVLMSIVFGSVFGFGSKFRIDPPESGLTGEASLSVANKAILGVIAIGVSMIIIGFSYRFMNAEHPLAHESFRAWACINVGVAVFTLGCLTSIVSVLRRRKSLPSDVAS